MKVLGQCVVSLILENYQFKKIRLKVLESLCTDVIIGLDLMKQHKTLQIKFGGSAEDLIINGLKPHCGLTAVNRDPPRLSIS